MRSFVMTIIISTPIVTTIQKILLFLSIHYKMISLISLFFAVIPLFQFIVSIKIVVLSRLKYRDIIQQINKTSAFTFQTIERIFHSYANYFNINVILRTN